MTGAIRWLTRPLQLYADDTCTGPPLATAVSDSAGKVAFTDSFGPGTYWLKETAAPPGYGLDTTVYKVVIRGGEATIYRSDTEKVTQIVNRSEVSLTILKTDRKDPANPLEGAQFTLTKDGADLGTYSTGPGRDHHTSEAYHRNLHPDGDGSTGGLPGADGADPLEGGGRDHHRCDPRRFRDLLLETHRQRRCVYADRYQRH